MDVNTAIKCILGIVYGFRNPIVDKFQNELKQFPELEMQLRCKYLRWCNGASFIKKNGNRSNMNEFLMMAILKGKVGDKEDLWKLAKTLYPAPGAAEYYMKEKCPFPTQVEVNKENPFSGGLEKNFNIFATTSDNANNNNTIALSPWFQEQSGYKNVCISNFDMSVPAHGKEYIREIGVKLGDTYHLGVLRVIWNKSKYEGYIYKKSEPSCRINWDSWKKSQCSAR